MEIYFIAPWRELEKIQVTIASPWKARLMSNTAAPPLLPETDEFFPGFERKRIRTSGAEINLVVGGSGPPLALIHGNPLTHVSWWKIAPSLARDFTVVALDLRGYGDSSKPEGGEAHEAYSFRAMGQDVVEVMATLGHDRFSVIGHDRGARVAYRLAVDQPGLIEKVAFLDIVPTHHVLSEVSVGWAQESYHWFFMSQKAPFPEDLLCRDLDYYMRYKLNKKGVGIEIFGEKALAEYIRCCTPEAIHAVCEDYRATLGIDFEMDSKDFGNRFVECPALVLWGDNSHVGRHFTPIETWRRYAHDVRGEAIPTGHYPAEHRPDIVYDRLWHFLKD